MSWRQVSSTEWRKGNRILEVSKKQRVNEYIVSHDYLINGNPNFKDNDFLRSFKKRSDAMAWAKDYMRKHP